MKPLAAGVKSGIEIVGEKTLAEVPAMS